VTPKTLELVRIGLTAAAGLTLYVDRRGGPAGGSLQAQHWGLLWPPLMTVMPGLVHVRAAAPAMQR
jgi:hypothetical protein